MSKYPYWVVQIRDTQRADWEMWGRRVYPSRSGAYDAVNGAYHVLEMEEFSRLERAGFGRIVQCDIVVKPQEVKS